ncbi:MAG: DUF3078 domain-containing protein [Muribaculaceae bacterium]|nr:DUF3078 domain-containing protein [Muribaculaceae bacterium]
MKHFTIVIAALSIISAAISADAHPQKRSGFRHIPRVESVTTEEKTEISLLPEIDSTKFIVRDVDEIISSLGTPDFSPTPVNKTLGPWVFLGYRHIKRPNFEMELPTLLPGIDVRTNDSTITGSRQLIEDLDILQISDDSIPSPGMAMEIILEEPTPDYSQLTGDVTPKWLRDALDSYRIQEDFMYGLMVTEPSTIDYSYWDLPVPPRLRDDDVTFAGYIRRMNLPELDPEKGAVLPEDNLRRIHWLHNVGAAMQFSQAYVSKNWYQGGNNHLALLFNFNWNVQLNQVYHPNLLFQSALSYKLGLNSTPQDEVHAYSISEDVLQYNLNTGLKAFKKWFYSFNLQFKTQILRNYEQNSMTRKASFLSPGDFNLGLGMAYSHQNQKKTLQLTATVSPLSYNLKTCITDKIDHAQFNIGPNRHTRSEIGSNGEFNMIWQITPNINYKTRIFLFTDYDYFLADWENTMSFAINKFLSTQIYIHMRYDTSTEIFNSWKHFMLREILSFGLTYTFSTKP